MKKNISINISGIIFHIEEDGYEKLKDYLETIHKYFSTYDDSTEITADIENRIAEIFLGKLKDGKQVITLEDVDALIATMGGIKDFKEVEMEEEADNGGGYKEAGAGTGTGTGSSSGGSTAYQQPTKLYRDEKRKILGGVIAGIAHHFSIDPLWIRLVFIIMFFGVWVFPAIPALLTVAYIVLWIVIPGTYDIPDERKYKKMFRNPDDKVLGGVASGIGAYFGVDVVIIRLLFIILIFFGGTGLILYIIFWIILPEAATITDKMEMQGEPLTLKNIETNIKKSLKVGESQEESLLVKILLFPFRLIASLIELISKALGPFLGFLVEAIRVAFGLILVLVAISLIVALFLAGGIALGVFTGAEPFVFTGLPLDVITQGIPALPFIGIFFASLIPAIFLVILGLSVITKNLMLNARVGWGLFALWIISLVIIVFTVPRIIIDFSREGNVVEVENYDFGNRTMVLKLHYTGDDEFERVTLKLRGQENSGVRLEKRLYSRGNSRADAMDNARMIDYGILKNDSILTFDSNFSFKPGAMFRGQSLDMTLYIPYDKPFMMDEDLKDILRSTIYMSGYSTSQIQGNTWMFTEKEGLRCMTCEEEPRENPDPEIFDTQGYNRPYHVKNFKSVNSNGLFKVNIVESLQTRVVANGRERDINDIEVSVDGDELVIRHRTNFRNWDRRRDEITINISTPDLEHLRLTGASKASVKGFNEDNMELHVSGASQLDAEVDVRSLRVNVEGASSVTLTGEGDNLTAEATGASSIDAFDYEVKNADMNVTGASNARINVMEDLEANTSGFGKIRYRGEPRHVRGSDMNVTREE